MEPIQPVTTNTVVSTPPPPALMEHPTLESLVKHDVISKDGANWLTIVSDPFHDKEITLAGFPDINMAASVVQCVKQSQAIAVPSTITTGTWDCNVVLWPKVDYNDHDGQWNATDYTNWTAATVTTVAPYAVGGLTALAGVSGTQLYGNSSSAAVTDLSGLSLPGSYLQGSSRIIGMGFEVVNTTSLLNVQGQVTCWRQPSPTQDNKSVGNFHASTYVTPVSQYLQTQPPSTLAQAMLLAGSKSWRAKDGCYVISTMNDTVNRVTQPQPMVYLSLTGDVTDSEIASDIAIGEGISSATGLVLGQSLVAPFHMAGAYFTGLSLQTTLQLNVNYYIERFPTPSEGDLVVLASPSSAYDPIALETYCRALSCMPTGVPQGLNPLGEWFADVLRNVSAVATPVLQALSPIVPGAGAGAMVSRGVNALLGPSKKQKAKAKGGNRQQSGQARANQQRGPRRKQPPRQNQKFVPKARGNNNSVSPSQMYGDY
jgi:hypothetical protein